MYSTGAILVTIAMVCLVAAVIALIYKFINYVIENSNEKQRKPCRWRVPGIFFISYLVFITIGLVLINQ